LDVEVARERRADRDRDGEDLEFHTIIVDTVGSSRLHQHLTLVFPPVA
jgi:hypothetical protein